jgi:hypothetical protein
MKRIVALAVAFTFALVHVPSVNAQLQESGVINGNVQGPSGPLGGATVQVIGTLGSIAGSAVTTGGGNFIIRPLAPGVYTVQVLGSNSQVIGASSATLTRGAMIATVNIDASAGTLAEAAVEVPAVSTQRRGLSTRMVLAGVGAAAASLGTLLVISTQEDVSGSR